MTDRRVRNLVMLTILLVWAVYLLATVARGEQPEKWSWGIAPGVYAALFRPGLGKAKQRPAPQRGEDDDEPDQRSTRRRTRAAGDER